jgi:hypothetical protein
MEWKNYNELEQDYNGIDNKYFLQLDENLDCPYNRENAQDYKKYMYNEKIEGIGDRNDKLNYYFLLNNLDLNNEYQNFSNCDNYNNGFIKSLNFQNYMNEEKRNQLSELNDNGNKELKKNLFKIQSDVNINNKDSSNEENYEMVNNYKNIPLKERMSIKKQKTKKLLENKTQRISTQEESKENNVDKNTISNNTQENLSSSSNNNSINNININSLNPSVIAKMNKKEIKMLRNRLSAQRSRDRKKKELIDLKTITRNLFEENEKLRNEIKERDNKIKELINLLCPKCQEKLKQNNSEIIVKESCNVINNTDNNEMQLTPSNIIAGKKKLALLMTGLFTIFCIFGTFTASNSQNFLRNLKEKSRLINKNNDFNDEKRVNVPFLIEKDYSIRHKKEIEMNQKIQKNNLKNKNLMVPASLFKNNSEQIISNINNSINNNNLSINQNNMKDIDNTNKTNIKEEIIHIDKEIKMSRNITYKDN